MDRWRPRIVSTADVESRQLPAMVSRRKILSRSRDDLNIESTYVLREDEEDVWYQKEKLYKNEPQISSHPITSHHIPSHPITSHHIPSHPITSHHIPSHQSKQSKGKQLFSHASIGFTVTIEDVDFSSPYILVLLEGTVYNIVVLEGTVYNIVLLEGTVYILVLLEGIVYILVLLEGIVNILVLLERTVYILVLLEGTVYILVLLEGTVYILVQLEGTVYILGLLEGTDHIHEVLEKWTQIDDEIWAKVIVLERNRRVAKAYARAPVLTINGSDDGFDGFRVVIGVDIVCIVAKCNASIFTMGGVKVKMDDEGNILVKRVSKSNVYVKITSAGEETSIGNDILKLSNCALEIDKPVKIFLPLHRQGVNVLMRRQAESFHPVVIDPSSFSKVDIVAGDIQQNSSALRIPTPLIPFPRLVGIFK
uniref:MH2 domain-containing protein n=1 Tax=Timema shepardi TaxID=629360 RepID=A0A7R9AZE8_TIMSH|nr:unnamed protein product [Timema shepardi]